MATAKNKEPKLEDSPLGMLLWSDGSSAPSNPGYGGWGLHGFMYSDLPPKKGAGHPTQVLTDEGYMEKAAAKSAGACYVKPMCYITGFGSFAQFITNNVAELAGAISGLDYAASHPIKTLTLLTDSKYVVEGATKWLKSWKRNNWIKADGFEVANKNYWVALDEKMSALTAKGVSVQIKWVKGHSIHLGNQLADKYASIGNLYSKQGVVLNNIETKPADGYWAPKSEKHPFLCQRRMYFCTNKNSSVPGEYHMGEHGKDDEMLGKRMTDGAYSFVKLQTPEPFMEMLRNKQNALACGAESIILARLDKLFEVNTYNDLLRFGEICIYQPSPHKLDLHVISKPSDNEDAALNDGEPLTKEIRPPRIAIRAIESVNQLHGVLLSWQDPQQHSLTTTEVTEVFYELDAKGDYLLKPEFIVGFSSLMLSVSYDSADLSKQEPVELFMGVDLPERNAMKRLEKFKPKVYVVTWKESDASFRHATIVKTENDIGIWAGMYSNLRFLSSAFV